jgi:adenine/guanine phosphoribosyltransferase-like PRPP-binding protein
MPVDLVADMLAQGATAEEILEAYPTLNEEMVSLAPLHGGALPKREPQPPAVAGKKPRP